MPKDVVFIQGFKKDGKLAYEHFCSIYDWYDGHNFLLDDEDSVRAFYGISSLEGIQYDSEGEETQRWQNSYAGSGELLENTCWFPDGTINHFNMAEGMQE